MKSLDHPSFLSNFQDHLMKLILTLLLVLSTLSSPSFGESSNIRYLEKKKVGIHLYTRMCIGGYEYVQMCRATSGMTCRSNFENINGQLVQSIRSEGGGVSC